MNEAYHQVLGKNLDRVWQQSSHMAEKSFAHLRELSQKICSDILKETADTDILRAVLQSDEAPRIYRESIPDTLSREYFAAVNKREEPFFRKQISRLSRLYLCRCIAKNGRKHNFAELQAFLFGSVSEITSEQDKKIAFLRNRQTFRAFECFAKTLGGVSVLYENNFGDALEAVAMGQATYAIVPIYSTSDGRLSSFYRMIEKHELCIVLTCDIDSDDGENMTTFALVYKERLALAVGSPRFSCKITFDLLSSISDITDAAAYFGAAIESLEALPILFSGRAGTFAVDFDLEYADTEGLLCYLALEYPQMSASAMYGKTERN